MNSYYDGFWRMDWGLGNPNKTATLIACLMIALWIIPLIWTRGFWPTLLVFTVLAACLVQTYSRGGMLSLLAGLAVLLIWAPRPWPKMRWLVGLASLWALGAFVLYAKAQTRYDQGLFTPDQSIHNRLIIWRHVPEMMLAAPWGWGLSKAGDSYTQWFQPTNQSFNYLNLVNSHFTFMVETGWLGSVVYVFAWLAIFTLCWPGPESRINAVPFALWATFGIGAFFSHVEESFWLWLLPALALGFVVLEKFKTRRWPSFFLFIYCAAASVTTVAALILSGLASSSLSIHFDAGMVTIGNGPEKTLVFVDRQVMGALYGHTFRKFLAASSRLTHDNTFIFVESADRLPSTNFDRLVVSGRFSQDTKVLSLTHGSQIIFVNPSCIPAFATLSANESDNTIVYFGEYSQIPARSSCSGRPGVRMLQIDGASDFIPTWPQAILSPPKI